MLLALECGIEGFFSAASKKVCRKFIRKCNSAQM